MISMFRFRPIRIVQVVLLMLTVYNPRASGEVPDGRILAKFPLSRKCVTEPAVQRLRTSVRWNEDHYDVETGIGVLMGVVRHPDTGVHERELAIIRLASLGPQLEGRPCLGYLGTIYDNARILEKRIILTCFLGSGDARGIPVFFRTLDNEQDLKLRLWAAGALEHWNIRRGVAEIVDLLASKEKLEQPARMAYVRDNALKSFRNANARNGWGFPQEEIRKSIETQLAGFDREEFKKRWESGDEETRKSLETRAQVPREEFLALYVAEIKKWFAENELRFPDWKPGDPLPEVPENEEKASADTKE